MSEYRDRGRGYTDPRGNYRRQDSIIRNSRPAAENNFTGYTGQQNMPESYGAESFVPTGTADAFRPGAFADAQIGCLARQCLVQKCRPGVRQIPSTPMPSQTRRYPQTGYLAWQCHPWAQKCRPQAQQMT